MATLPGGFSPTNALKQVVLGQDADVFGNYTVKGGARTPATGLVGRQLNTDPYNAQMLQARAKLALAKAGQGGSGQPAAQNSGGGTGSDPYYQWGGTARYNSLLSGFNQQKDNIYGTSRDAADQGARNLQGSILDFLDTYRSGQKAIDTKSVNNELAKRQGQSSILGMVGRGIRSGGIQLANKNAGDSSAADAIARAYGDIGGREMRSVGNQYELGNRDIAMEQEQLGTQANQFARHYEDQKINTVNSIAADARDRLAALDAQIMDADLPNRIAIEQEKNNIRAEALGKLSQFDQLLAEERGKVKAITPEERARQAAELQNAGYDLGEGAFDFNTQAPAQFAGTGPFASELPLFMRPRNRQEA